MNRLTWIEYRRHVQDEHAPVFLPVGALEQHGPHLPLGTDAILSAAVAQGMAEQTAGLVAPALAYGYKSQPKYGGGQHFPGTTSLDAMTLAHTVRDTVREFARHGVGKLVIVNGHYENQWFLIEGIDLAMRELGKTPLKIMRLEYWDFFTAPTLEKAFPDGFPGYALEHAAALETSTMLHYHPELVRLDRIPNDPAADFPPYDIYPTRTEWVPPSGVLSSARAATKEKGAAMAHGTHDPDLLSSQEGVLVIYTQHGSTEGTEKGNQGDKTAVGWKCQRLHSSKRDNRTSPCQGISILSSSVSSVPPCWV